MEQAIAWVTRTPAARVAARLPEPEVAVRPVAAEATVEPWAEPERWNPDEAVTALYRSDYSGLVRLAALLLRDTSVAEEVVQDAFVSMHRHWWRLRQRDRAAAYLRRTVVNRCRSALRRRAVEAKHQPTPDPPMPSAEQTALDLVDRTTIMAALRSLPTRQREALVLRYYGGLSEAEIADAMRVSKGSVKRHASRGIAALRNRLGGTR